MSGNKHPSASLLAKYATGCLVLAPAIAVASHIDGCFSCGAKVAEIEEVEASAMMAVPDAPLTTDVMDSVFARINEPAIYVDTTISSVEMLGDVVLPAAVARVGLYPRRWLAPGLWAAHLKVPRSEDWRSFLLRVPAGTTIPRHVHGRDEIICVLQGGFHDGDTYAAGDFAQNLAGTAHRLTVEASGPCACLISLRGQVQWQGWSKLLGPVLGI